MLCARRSSTRIKFTEARTRYVPVGEDDRVEPIDGVDADARAGIARVHEGLYAHVAAAVVVAVVLRLKADTDDRSVNTTPHIQQHGGGVYLGGVSAPAQRTGALCHVVHRAKQLHRRGVQEGQNIRLFVPTDKVTRSWRRLWRCGTRGDCLIQQVLCQCGHIGCSGKHAGVACDATHSVAVAIRYLTLQALVRVRPLAGVVERGRRGVPHLLCWQESRVQHPVREVAGEALSRAVEDLCAHKGFVGADQLLRQSCAALN
jgi:hypothetical protein